MRYEIKLDKYDFMEWLKILSGCWANDMGITYNGAIDYLIRNRVNE